jgi:hypothetical protein
MPDLDPTRKYRLTASEVRWLADGDRPRIQSMFLRHTGDPRYVEEPFDEWLGMYGNVVEEIAIRYHAKKYGLTIEDRGTQFISAERPFLSATLDCSFLRGGARTVMDVKCVSAWVDLDEAIRTYTPQIITQRYCRDAEAGSLLVVRGGAEPTEIDVFFDEQYRQDLFAQIDNYWTCVETLVPPFELQFKRIIPPERWRTVDLDKAIDTPNWAHEMRGWLGTWADSKAAAASFEEAKTAIKVLTPDDVGKITCGGITVSRARNNAITIRAKEERA